MTKSFLWLTHFEQNAWDVQSLILRRTQSDLLPQAHRKLLLASIQQFQLGEGSEGKGLRAAAEAMGAKMGDPMLGPCYARLIGEEQRHSLALGLFLAQQGARCLSKDWVDGCFRWLRRLAGFELYARVLVTAEFIAVPYYEALRDASHCQTLKAICERILQDESHHLRFQGWAVGLAAQGRGKRAGKLVRHAHELFTLLTCLVVWAQHGGVFRLAGWRLQDLLHTAWRAGMFFHQVVEGDMPGEPETSVIVAPENSAAAGWRLRA